MLFCTRCGSNVGEGSKFCPTCGTGVETTTTIQMSVGDKQVGSVFFAFIGKSFRWMLIVIMITFVIVSAITGYEMGGSFGSKTLLSNLVVEEVFSIIGGILGLFLGIASMVLFGGFLATILKIDENVQNMANELDSLRRIVAMLERDVHK